MEPIYWAALFSFVVGACGYIIVRFWIVPISRYRKLKRLLVQGIDDCARKLSESKDPARWKHAAGKANLREFRRLGVKLVDLHNGDLPYWYRLILLTRQESPIDAIEPILRLENMATGDKALKCIEEIGGHLGVKNKRKPNAD